MTTPRWTEWIDRVGGKIVYRAVGTLAGLCTLVLVWAAWSAFSAGTVLGGLMVSAMALLFGLVTRYCWSPKRRLSDIEE